MKRTSNIIRIAVLGITLLGATIINAQVVVDTLSSQNNDLSFDSMVTRNAGRFTTSGGGTLTISSVVVPIKKNGGADIVVSMNIYDDNGSGLSWGDNIIGSLTADQDVSSAT